MSNQLQVNLAITDDKYLLTAELILGSELPRDIFIYENVFTEPATTTLGAFLGTCNLGELTRFKVFAGEYVPIFGNKYLRHSQAKIWLSPQDDADAVTTQLINAVKSLASQHGSSNVSKVVDI